MSRKYCIFSAQYLPSMGGVERYTYYIAKKLVEGGDRVTVVTSLKEGVPEREIQEGIEIIRVPSFQFMKGRMPVLRLGKKKKKVEKKLAKRKYDLVIVNTRFYFHSLWGLRFAKRNKAKSICIDHGTGYLELNNPVLNMAERVYEHGITMLDKHYCQDFYGVSQACCEWIKTFGIKAKGVLYNSVDVREMEEYIDKRKVNYREKYDIADSDIVVTFTGRVLKIKGIEQLVEAVKDIKCERRIILMIAGDGELDEYVKKQAEQCEYNRIIPLGRIDFESVSNLLSDSDILCLPSDSEGFPTSVLEAIVAGCYVITTYNGGARELISSDELGMIIKDNDKDTVKKAILTAINNTDREAAVKKAYKVLCQDFTFDATVDRIRHIG